MINRPKNRFIEKKFIFARPSEMGPADEKILIKLTEISTGFVAELKSKSLNIVKVEDTKL